MRQMVVGWLVVLVALGAEITELGGLAIFRHDLYAAPLSVWHPFMWLLCREDSCWELVRGMWYQLT